MVSPSEEPRGEKTEHISLRAFLASVANLPDFSLLCKTRFLDKLEVFYVNKTAEILSKQKFGILPDFLKILLATLFLAA